MQYQLIILCLILASTQCTTFFSWVWSISSDNISEDVDSLSLISIPYETTVEDEKFLHEASKLTDIQLSSALEICQHKIVLKLKGSCNSMTEEELGKLSVGLLNCQSAVEGRQIYPCTGEMSLKQCTINMDPDMWNAYHLISNRARAMCYSVRNVQFRALSELAVNRLIQSARSQIDSLNSLKKSHDDLKDTTEEILSTIAEKNQILMDEYKYLKNAQVTAYGNIRENLRDLYNEKILLRSGHAQLTAMFDNIERRLKKTSQHFAEEFREFQKNHEELLNNLAISQQESLENLKRINSTISSIQNMADKIHQEIERIIGWLDLHFRNSDEQFGKFLYTSVHILYLLGAMIIAAFLNVPFFMRLLIITLIPFNLMISLKNGTESNLDFTSVTLLIFLSTAMYYALIYIFYFIGFIIKKIGSMKVDKENFQSLYFPSFKKHVKNFISRKKNYTELNDYPSLISEDSDENKLIHLENTIEEDEYFEHVGCRLRQKKPNNIYSLSESKSSKSKMSSVLCLARTQFGDKCRSRVRPGQLYCDQHK